MPSRYPYHPYHMYQHPCYKRTTFAPYLSPGWNLVSPPVEPQMSDINDVIPADHPASIVLTYDPTILGAWLSASRGEDGMFSGSLKNIRARMGYWIFADTLARSASAYA